MRKKLVVYWLRRDFRLSDNPALFAAVAHSKKEKIDFLPLFIVEDYMLGNDPKQQFGFPSRFFLSKIISKFSKNFQNFTVLQGKAAKTIIKLGEDFEVEIFVNEDVYPDFYTQIRKIRDAGIYIKLFKDALSISKDTVSGSGNMYSVFTPFKKSVWTQFCSIKVFKTPDLSDLILYKKLLGDLDSKKVENSFEKILKLFSESRILNINDEDININDLGLVMPDFKGWYTSEEEVILYFNLFLKNSMSTYKDMRDKLDSESTSRMSTALSWGLVSSRTLRQMIQNHYKHDFLDIFSAQADSGAAHYISELIWREFYKYLIYHKPELMKIEFQEKFRGTIEWVDYKIAKHRFTKWIQGETGYPVVDAAMMELAKTGYMHNRARMIVASVLTKNLGVDWRWGQEYFRAMLIDLDDASNNGGWQWGASVGADPKPIRIFNPYLQAENYDKNGLYQKKYLREDYTQNPPEVIVEHKDARAQALMRYGLSGDKNVLS